MMVPMWMNTDTPPHIVAEARARLKVDLLAKGMVENQGKYTTVFQRKIATYISRVYSELEKNPWLETQLLKRHQFRRAASRGRIRKVTRT